MISKTEFEVIELLLKSPNIDEIKFEDEKEILLKEKFIKYRVVDYRRMPNVIGNVPIYDGYEVTPLGQRAYEEYKNFLNNENRENHIVEVAEEANTLAKEANQLSKTANKKSHNANVLSLIAIIVPSLLSVGALIVSILAYFKN